MSRFFAWIEDRTGLLAAGNSQRQRLLPGGARWGKVWSCLFLFAFFVEAITGFCLWAYYSPSAQTAWESVYYLQSQVTAGWLLRAVHHYGAHVFLALVIIYVLQMIFTAAYRAPRELVFWAAIGLGLFVLAAIITGDLLYWDQNGYTSTKVRTGFLNLLPGIGSNLLTIALGGPDLGNLTLTRFLALHVGLFAAAVLVLAVIHTIFVQRADAIDAARATTVLPWWPYQAWRNSVACLLLVAVVMALACQHGVSGEHRGVALGSPADPVNSYDAARPEWMLLGVYEFAHFYPGIVSIFALPGVVVGVALLMPFLAHFRGGQVFNVAFTLLILIAVVGLSGYVVVEDLRDPKHQAAIAAERDLADRAFELARGQGIPPTGALTLLRKDPKSQGPKLFAQQCASCHNWLDSSGQGIAAEKPTAPNLFHYARREWLTGLLDPKKIVGPDYYGNTSLRRGEMPNFVKQTLADLDEADREDLGKLIKAVSAEAQLRDQRREDAKDAADIEEGRKLVKTFGCTDCHAFGTAKGAGAPMLNGYGSREWIRGVVSNPADKRYFGDKNDRMPAYEKQLSAEQIDLVTDWLRGEWYEPAAVTGE